MENSEKVIEYLDKIYGKNTVISLNSDLPIDIECFSSGIKNLDKILGGGIPRGRIIEIYGKEASGKSTLALHVMKEAQNIGKVLYVDTENAFDSNYAKRIGVDLSQVIFSQPSTAEEALTIIENFAKCTDVSLIVLDSVAALVPKVELEGNVGDAVIGKTARLMSQHLRKIGTITKESKCTIIYINQLRTNIGVMFGNPEVTTGGNALKYYATIRLDVRKVGLVKDGDEVIGITSKIRVAKNKLSVPFKEATFDITNGMGIDTLSDLFDMALENGLVQKKGSWFYYGDEKLGQGKINAMQTIEEKYKKELEEKL